MSWQTIPHPSAQYRKEVTGEQNYPSPTDVLFKTDASVLPHHWSNHSSGIHFHLPTQTDIKSHQVFANAEFFPGKECYMFKGLFNDDYVL